MLSKKIIKRKKDLETKLIGDALVLLFRYIFMLF